MTRFPKVTNALAAELLGVHYATFMKRVERAELATEKRLQLFHDGWSKSDLVTIDVEGGAMIQFFQQGYSNGRRCAPFDEPQLRAELPERSVRAFLLGYAAGLKDAIV